MNILELSLIINGFPINDAKRRLNAQQDDRMARRDAIVDYHRQNNSFYRTLLQNREMTSFESLPILTKKDFQRPIKELISDGLKSRDIYIGNTSGSSGNPFYYAKDKQSHALTHAIVLKLYAQHGVTPASIQARFYGIPSSGISKYKEKLKDFLCNRVRFHVFDLSDQQLSLYLNRFSKIKFEYVYGYTSAIVQFAKFIIRQNIKLIDICKTLKCCIVTSEVCTKEDRSIIEEAFGVKVINEYGCSEAGLIAFENRDGEWQMVEENSYYEIVDDSGHVLPFGNEGRIIITSLSNRAMPIIRYEIGDIGIIDRVDGKLILRKLLGRVNDMIKLPSGKIAAGLTFYYVSRSLLEKNSIVREFIVRQTAIDTFEFDIVSDRDLNDQEVAFLKQQLDDYLEPNLTLLINRVEKINRPNSGKIKHFYSEIK